MTSFRESSSHLTPAGFSKTIVIVLLLCSASVIGDAQTCAGPEHTVQLFQASQFSAVGVLGDLMVVADNIGLSTWNISDPVNPEFLGQWRSPRGEYRGWGNAIHMDPRGFAVMIPGLQVFDVKDPSAPKPLSSPSPAASSWSNRDRFAGLAEGDTYFVYSNWFSDPLRILDLADPFAPTWHDPQWSHSGYILDVAFAGTSLAVLSRSTLYLYNMSDPLEPRLIHEFKYIDSDSQWNILDIRASSDLIILTLVNHGSNSLVNVIAVDLSDFETPEVVDLTDILKWTYIREVALDGRILYAQVEGYNTSTVDSLQAIDLSDPHAPIVLSQEEQWDSWSLTVGEGVVVSSHGDWIKIFDRRSPLSLFSQINADGVANAIAVSGTLGVVAGDYGGILTVHLPESGEPEILARLQMDGYSIDDVILEGDVAYALATQDVLFCIDVSQPRDPKLLSSFATLHWTDAFDVDGGIAIAAAERYKRSTDLQIIDVRDPAHPIQRSTLTVENSPLYSVGIALRDEIAYIAAGEGLSTIGFSDPDNPEILDSIELYLIDYNEEARTVALLENHAVVGSIATNRGSCLVDISDPADLQESNWNADYNIWDLHASGSTVAFPTFRGPLYLADFADPLAPVFTTMTRPMRGYDAGTLAATKWYLPNGPFLEVYSRSCDAPVASFYWSGKGFELYFHNTSTGYMPTVSWDFGDGTSSSAHAPSHRYEISGVFEVTLEVTNESGTDTYVETVFVRKNDIDPVRRPRGRRQP